MKKWRSDKQRLSSYLCYQGVFNCGLSEHEISTKCYWRENSSLRKTLQELQRTGAIKKIGNSYFLTSVDSNLLGVKREVRETDSKKVIEAGESFYRFLQSTGLVMLIAVSGSAAHGNCVSTEEKEADLDIFLVCKPATIQIVRTLLALHMRCKKIAAFFGSTKYPRLCPNTLMDFESLEVKNQSIFTAYDLLNLRIITGEETFKILKNSNAWTQKYFDSENEIDRHSKFEEHVASPATRFLNWILFVVLTLRLLLLAPIRGSDIKKHSLSSAYRSDKQWCLYHQNHLGGGYQPAIAKRFAELYSENFGEDLELFEFLFPLTNEKGIWISDEAGLQIFSETEKEDSHLGYR